MNIQEDSVMLLLGYQVTILFSNLSPSELSNYFISPLNNIDAVLYIKGRKLKGNHCFKSSIVFALTGTLWGENKMRTAERIQKNRKKEKAMRIGNAALNSCGFFQMNSSGQFYSVITQNKIMQGKIQKKRTNYRIIASIWAQKED